MAKSTTKRHPPADAARNGGPAGKSDLLAGLGLAIEHRPVEALIPYARNARTHSEDQVAAIAGSIREFGFTNPVLVDGANGIIAGHGRLAELGVDLAGLGFEAGEIDDLLHRDAPDPREEETPEPPADPVSRPGDLWLCGPHRVLCGDATNAGAVARLLDGVEPHLIVSDPPYGVAYDPAWRNASGAAATRRTGKVMNDDRADWREAWALFPGAVAYVWHGALHAGTVAESLMATGFEIRSQIIWAKDRLVLSRGDYHGVAVTTQLVVFLWFGLPARVADALAIGAIFTLVSVARSFSLRRLFEAIRVPSTD